jgi:hypothetical protein
LQLFNGITVLKGQAAHNVFRNQPALMAGFF